MAIDGAIPHLSNGGMSLAHGGHMGANMLNQSDFRQPFRKRGLTSRNLGNCRKLTLGGRASHQYQDALPDGGEAQTAPKHNTICNPAYEVK